MTDNIDWSLTTWTGSRRQQHREFLALPFEKKLAALEQMGETLTLFSRAEPRPKKPGRVSERPDV